LYFLALAGFLLFFNLKVRSGPSKAISFIGIWASVGTSVVLAVVSQT
jgi:hypothetical protein